MENLIIQTTGLVKEGANKPVTTSLKIAEVFRKEHFHVIRDIENLEVPKDFHSTNFGLMFNIRQLPNGGQDKDKYYNITRSGFAILVMGYTGKKAMKFKIAYIEAFDLMEAELKKQVASKEAKYFKVKGELMMKKHELDIQIKQLKHEIKTTDKGKQFNEARKELAEIKSKLTNIERKGFKHIYTPTLKVIQGTFDFK